MPWTPLAAMGLGVGLAGCGGTRELWEADWFQLRGFAKVAWTDDDVAAPERCYPGQRVILSPSRTMLFVAPPDEAFAEHLGSVPTAGTEVGRGVRGRRHHGDSEVWLRQGRIVLRVTRDQVEAARGLLRLHAPEDVDPLVRKVADARPATAEARDGCLRPAGPGRE